MCAAYMNGWGIIFEVRVASARSRRGSLRCHRAYLTSGRLGTKV